MTVWVDPEPSCTDTKAPTCWNFEVQNALWSPFLAVVVVVAPVGFVEVTVAVDVSHEKPKPVNSCGVARPRFVSESTPFVEL